MTMQKIILFSNLQQARDYRYENGTGGWIFEPEKKEDTAMAWANQASILFPPDVTARQIFNHPITKGRSGNLIG